MKYLEPKLEIILFDVGVFTFDQTLVDSGTGGDGDIINPGDGETTDANSL